jgi:hypothetical protein
VEQYVAMIEESIEIQVGQHPTEEEFPANVIFINSHECELLEERVYLDHNVCPCYSHSCSLISHFVGCAPEPSADCGGEGEGALSVGIRAGCAS